MTYDLKALRELEKRLAEAKGDRFNESDELGVAIYEALGICSYIPDEGDPTKSLDAAVALVERVLPGWFWRAGHGSLHAGWAHLNRVHPDHCDRKDEASASASTPTLALCLACVRALIAQDVTP